MEPLILGVLGFSPVSPESCWGAAIHPPWGAVAMETPSGGHRTSVGPWVSQHSPLSSRPGDLRPWGPSSAAPHWMRASLSPALDRCVSPGPGRAGAVGGVCGLKNVLGGRCSAYLKYLFLLQKSKIYFRVPAANLQMNFCTFVCKVGTWLCPL